MIHHPISFSQYRALPGIANSLLKLIDRSPAHLRHAADNPRVATPAMLVGSLTDHLLFGTELAYAVSPYDEFRSKEAKEWREMQRSAGIAIFTSETVTEVRTMVEAVQAHPAAKEILAAGRSQVAVTSELAGVDCKGLIDWVPDEISALADLKTTEDASPEVFARHAINMGYDVQAAFYLDLWHQNTGEGIPWVWIVVDADPPHAVAVYRASDAALARGRKIYERRLRVYGEALRSGNWHGYSPGVETLELPAWAEKEAM